MGSGAPMLSPPAATVEMMGKGKRGKGKNWTSWPREVGTRQYLKNFRKGLRFQRWRAWSDVEAAPDDAKSVAQECFLWVLAKQKSLDYGYEMVKDGPVMQQGGQMQFADLMKTAARRCLTKAEIRWNAAFIEQEAEEQRRGSASAATPATPAPDTAPCKTKRGEANAAPMRVGPPPPRGRSRSPHPATPAPATPPWRMNRVDAADAPSSGALGDSNAIISEMVRQEYPHSILSTIFLRGSSKSNI